MHNYFIREGDKRHFEEKIKPKLVNGKKGYVYAAFTYITPNYSTLLFLQELYSFAKSNNCKVILVMWDMSSLSNKYYKRMKKQVSDSEFINQRIKELYDIAHSIGFEQDSISIYKSSELWKRFISYGEEDIYQGFYSTLVQMKVEKYALSYKASYFIQMPLDLFFCHYFYKLFPEDVDSRIDLIFFEGKRERLYEHARESMHEQGIISYKSPVFVIMEDCPYLNYNEYEPEWNMTFPEIHEIISNLKPSKQEISRIYKLLGEHVSLSEGEIYSNLAEHIYKFLQKRKKACEALEGRIDENIKTINDKTELLNIGSILRSQISVDLLLRADGKKSLSKIAKEMNKSIPTISTYVKKLKKQGLIRVLSNGNLKRNIKGVKVNFELGF